MVEMAVVSAAISAVAAAVNLFDQIADQVERFITKSPMSAVPIEHRMNFAKEVDAIVARD